MTAGRDGSLSTRNNAFITHNVRLLECFDRNTRSLQEFWKEIVVPNEISGASEMVVRGKKLV